MLEPGHFTSLATGLFCLIRLVRRLALSWRIRWCSLQFVLNIERGCAAYFEKQPHNCYIAIISATGELVYSAIERLNTLTRDSQDQAWKKVPDKLLQKPGILLSGTHDDPQPR